MFAAAAHSIGDEPLSSESKRDYYSRQCDSEDERISSTQSHFVPHISVTDFDGEGGVTGGRWYKGLDLHPPSPLLPPESGSLAPSPVRKPISANRRASSVVHRRKASMLDGDDYVPSEFPKRRASQPPRRRSSSGSILCRGDSLGPGPGRYARRKSRSAVVSSMCEWEAGAGGEEFLHPKRASRMGRRPSSVSMASRRPSSASVAAGGAARGRTFSAVEAGAVEKIPDPAAKKRRYVVAAFGTFAVLLVALAVLMITITLKISPEIDEIVRKENEQMMNSLNRASSNVVAAEDNLDGADMNVIVSDSAAAAVVTINASIMGTEDRFGTSTSSTKATP